MSRIRAVFLGTPAIASSVLEAMIKDPHYEVVGVVTQPDRPAGRHLRIQPSAVKSLAEPLGLPVLTPENVNQPEVLNAMAEWRAEVAVVVAFGQILKQPLLDLYPRKLVNLHASLLPRWRGAAPIQRALMAGDSETGISLQVMVKKLDAGPLLGSRKISLREEDTAIEVFAQMAELGSDLIAVELMDYMRGNLVPLSQDEKLVTLAPKIRPEEAEIDWSRSATDIVNLVRGLALSPVAVTRRQGKLLKVHKAKVAQSSGRSGSPGSVCLVESDKVVIHAGQGAVELQRIQPESRAVMSVKEYLKGYPIKLGEQLGEKQ